MIGLFLSIPLTIFLPTEVAIVQISPLDHCKRFIALHLNPSPASPSSHVLYIYFYMSSTAIPGTAIIIRKKVNVKLTWTTTNILR